MRVARGILLFVASIASAMILARPPACFSKRHLESGDPRLLVEAAVSAMESMEEEGTAGGTVLAERFYDLDRRLVEAGPGAIRPLTTLLAHPHHYPAEWATSVLERIGSAAIPGLIRALSHPIRSFAIYALAQFEPDARIIAAVAAADDDQGQEGWHLVRLYSHLSNSDNLYVERSSWSFARPGRPPGLSEEAVEALHEVIRAHPDWVEDVSHMLATRAEPWVVTLLADRLAAKLELDPAAADSAFGAWERCVDASAASPLSAEQKAAFLLRVPPIGRGAIEMLLRLGGEEGLRLVESELVSPDPTVRCIALSELDESGKLTWALMEPVLKAGGTAASVALGIIRSRKLTEGFETVRGMLGSDMDHIVVETLVKLDPEAARPILEGAAKSGPSRAEATAHLESVDLLTTLAGDPETGVRYMALKRLIDLRAPGIGALLVERMHNDPAQSSVGLETWFPTRMLAAEGLGLIGGSEWEDDLIECFKTGDPQLAAVAADSLGRIGGPKALAVLRNSHRTGLTVARARLGDPDVASELLGMLRNRANPGIRPVDQPTPQEYAELLGRMGEPGLRELLGLLKLPIEKVHPHVMAGLALSKDPRARAALEAGLRSRHHAALRTAAAQALAENP